MQRVLSFQAARGFEETSEFVTKRMCISFLFSIGFLCLVCGFCVGRFAAETAVDTRAEKERLELSGNGLENIEYLRQILMEKLQNNNHSVEQLSYPNGSIKNIEETLLRLEYLSKLTFEMGCLIGTVLGRREPDKHVVLYATEPPTIAVIIEIIKELNNLNIQFKWTPRRSLTFMVCEEYTNKHLSIKDLDYVPTYRLENIIAFLSLEGNSLYLDGQYVTAGSYMINSVVLETLKENKNIANGILDKKLSRLNINIPHARIKYINSQLPKNGRIVKDNEDLFLSNWKTLAHIATTSIWKLSQITLLHWYPRTLGEIIHEAFSDLHSVIPAPLKDSIEDKIQIITKYGESLTEKINIIKSHKSLDGRMMNDLISNLEISLLCPDENSISQTDIAILYKLTSNQTNIDMYLERMSKCFDRVIQSFTVNNIT